MTTNPLKDRAKTFPDDRNPLTNPEVAKEWAAAAAAAGKHELAKAWAEYAQRCQ